jgi:hypothetical protein
MSELKGKKAADIFDYSNLDKSYKFLIKKYHPDAGGDHEDFMYLQKLYMEAREELKNGLVITDHYIYFLEKNERCTFETRYDFGYGCVYCGAGRVNIIYQFNKGQVAPMYTDFQRSGVSPDNFTNKILPSLPGKDEDKAFDAGNKHFIIMPSRGDYLLQEVIDRADIPVETGIWILNRLYALGCYMQSAKIYNLDISPYTILINLEHHRISLAGGWWYMATPKSSLKMPVRTYKLLPRKVRETKCCTIEVVGEQIHATMKDIFHGRKIHPAFERWIKLPARSNILDEYEIWQNSIMNKICPVRAFYKWTI